MNSIEVTVDVCQSSVDMRIADSREESLSIFTELDENQREMLVRDAWTIGLRAIANAFTLAQESKLGDIVSTASLSEVKTALFAHIM